MSKIPFDIKFRPQIESSDYKVETQNGCIARIICWDRKDNNYPIVALFEEEISGKECLLSYTQNGQHVKGTSNVSDLFIVTPEPEMSELELAIAKYRPPTDSKETIQRIAAELLSLARKQLQPEIDAEIEKAYKTADEVMYRKGKEDGIVEARNDISARIIALKQAKDRAEEALKDLPRWIPNKFDKHNFETCKAYLDTPWYLCYQDKMINVSELVEKLPGFEEDE